MTHQNLTEIIVVLDRSGSMQSVCGATIEAFNGYIDSQKSGSDQVQVTLIQFDDQYEPWWKALPITKVRHLNSKTYVPRGSTALYDAVGRTIVETDQRYAAMADAKRPGKVLFVIQTDGFENASRSFTSHQINDLIAQQRDTYAWQFVFLGANQDAIASAAQFGLAPEVALTYGATHSGTMAAFDVLGAHTAKYRQAASARTAAAGWAFTDTDRRRSAR